MKHNLFKIFQQAILVLVACFLLWIAFSQSFKLTTGMSGVDLGVHGNTALILTVVFGGGFGMGLAALFFYLAHKQTDEED
jgi:hypothetical protein